MRPSTYCVLLFALVGVEAFTSGAATLRRPLSHAGRVAAAPLSVLDLERSGAAVSEAPSLETAYDCTVDECVGDRSDSGVSYRTQFEELFEGNTGLLKDGVRTSKPVPKPSLQAQKSDPSAKKVFNSDVYGTMMRPKLFNRQWTSVDIGRVWFFSTVHILGAFALLPRFFSWKMLAAQFLLYCASGMGITYSYHRQLAHKSFRSPKWLEYLAAICGMCALQGAPLDWVSDHRYHHLHTETPLDPHSSFEGFYWSHLGWMLDSTIYEQRCGDSSNVADLAKQPFYQLTSKYYFTGFFFLHWGLIAAVGGLAGVVWRAFFTSLLYHVTWFVNSASHVWGRQEYATGDASRNNWWVGFLAFGEGWHNNHHAFEYSARHGLRTRQFDITWIIISLLRKVGLVTNVKLPSEAAKARLALTPEERGVIVPTGAVSAQAAA